MDNKIYIRGRLDEAVTIPYISDKIPHAGVIINLLHLELFKFVSGVNYQALGLVSLQNSPDVHFSERTRPTCYEDRFIIKHDRP
ncbi:hypothetical protein D3C72_2116890 [compost metagenome]